VTVGVPAAEAIARVRADIYFMGVSGLHPDTGLTTGDAEEAAIKRPISQQAAEAVVLASREKLGAASPYLMMLLTHASAVVVEPELPEEVLKPFRLSGLDIVEA
jgi:DeoR/GlpR family transcriptional regulator of sugar metabolism